MSFNPTPKQASALQNMEEYIGIQNPREHFEDSQSFQEYFELIKKKADKKTITRKKNPGPRKKSSIQNPEALAAYGKKYAMKYQPSSAKLKQMLLEKCDRNEELAQSVMENYFAKRDDFGLAQNWVFNFLESGLNRRKIQEKLFTKRFDRDTIDKVMEALCPEGESLLNPDQVEQSIEKYKRQGLSPQQIKMKLCESSQDRELVEEILEKSYQDDEELNNLKNLLDKLKRQNLDDKKIIQRLMRKGFSYGLIKEAMQE